MKPTADERQSKIVPATDGSPIKILKPDMRFDFGPENWYLAVKELIERHVGEAQAITIEEIGKELAPLEWGFNRTEFGMVIYPHQGEIIRRVKAIVSRLKRKDRRFGASRASRGSRDFPGYYIISSAREMARSLLPYFDQAFSMLDTVAKMTKLDLFIPELRAKRAQIANQRLIATESTENVEA